MTLLVIAMLLKRKRKNSFVMGPLYGHWYLEIVSDRYLDHPEERMDLLWMEHELAATVRVLLPTRQLVVQCE
jgi:hypothetical protein